MTRKVVLRSVAACDGVNRSRDGKVNLFGVYPNAIRVETQPSFFEVFIYANFTAGDGDGPVNVEFRVVAPKAAGTGEVEIGVGTKYFDIEAPLLGLVEEDDTITFEWRTSGGRWKVGAKWEVVVSKSARQLDDDETKKLRSFFRNRVSVSSILLAPNAKSGSERKELAPSASEKR